MTQALPAPRSDFIGLEDKIHLATGGQPPLLTRHRDAFEAFAVDKARGMSGYENHWRVVDAVRAQLAPMMGLAPEDIALTGNASEGIVKVLSSIEWREGDNVVVSERDYASGRYALASLGGKGVEIRTVPARQWRIETDDLLAACDTRTCALYISQVNAMTGQLIDIGPLSTALEGSSTVLLLDASHALGVVPVRGDLASFTVSSCYKFALGIHEGIFAWNQHRHPNFIPFGVGWAAASAGDRPDEFRRKSGAQRVEFGNAGHLGAYLLRESLEYLASFGMNAVNDHVQGLCLQLIAGMEANDLEIMTPSAPGEQAGNAAFVCEDPRAFVTKAEADRIYVWGDDSRIRLSAHLFTAQEDVDIFLENLPRYLG
jgi:cysteine desulfurase/selenocysteine lyase